MICFVRNNFSLIETDAGNVMVVTFIEQRLITAYYCWCRDDTGHTNQTAITHSFI